MVSFSVRQPLLLRGAIALAIIGVVRIAIALGLIPPQWDLDEARVEQVIDMVIVGWAWLSARAKVTPVADPRTDDGRPLMPLR
ncbi:hypothetical protein [Bailinhaonella thermotolerans]|uniref:Uncharacterized protein n=1 Tax=Bailinhaonella thermotolerans TaxID=1070861 RepID=A0A3A4A1H7_9ACTN|nr:hypothetical protein [Bailinhaonella thermotolerans]RJL21122.1 hypothetical protein D5H75_38600 [Bailinhaonella thermotolerans]